MWADSETNRDFLNFRAVANTAAEIIVQAKEIRSGSRLGPSEISEMTR